MLQDEVSFVLTEQQENIFSEPLQMEFPNPNIKDVTKFQKRLISHVRRRRQLYDAQHELFRDIESKEKVWAKIATSLNTNVEKCKNTWADLRYQYQRHVRRLRKYLLYKNKQRKRRPVMALETEMLFLWRFIPQQSIAPNPYAEPDSDSDEVQEVEEEEDDDVVMLEDEQPVVIVLDDEDNRPAVIPSPCYKVTPEMHKLLKLIKGYPELYDHKHKYFHDYRRKGIIWAGIANESSDKATKLMKQWIQLQTRFEWECVRNKSLITDYENDIRSVMQSMEPYILQNPNTVFKHSAYLKNFWHEPIDHFKNIYNLVATLKRYPKVVLETEKELNSDTKTPVYFMYWSDIARYREANAGQFEVTWLILRYFYWELMNMRKSTYQLQDKWYFESIITDLYETVKATLPATGALPTTTMTPTPTSTANTVGPPSNVAVTPRPILPKMSAPLWTSLTSTNNSPAPTSTATVSLPVNTPRNSSVVTTTPKNMTLPIIVSAKSLASAPTPNPPVSRGLQITPVMPANAMTVVPTNGMSYSGQGRGGNNGYMTTTTPTTPTPTIAPPQRPIAQPKTIIPPNSSPQKQYRKLHQLLTNPLPTQQPPVKLPTRPTVKLPTHPPQLLGQSYPPVPKIASVHTIANRPNGPSNVVPPPIISSSTVTNNFTLDENKLPTFKTRNPWSAKNQQTDPSPTTPLRPILPMPPNILQVAQLPHLPPLSPAASPSNTPPLQSTVPPPPLRPIVTPSPLVIRPVLQPSVQPLSNLAIPASVIPNPAYNPAKAPPAAPSVGNGTATAQALNGNEILIELIASPCGNQLVVHGPPLEDNFTMTMEQTALFIREAMALPLLHNRACTKGSRVNAYWVFLASKFNMPAHVCRAVWNFLSENFSHFSKIAPMEELMKPFKTEAKPWRTSTSFFKRFLENFVRRGWFKYDHKLPSALEKIGNQRCLYQDLTRGNKPHVNSEQVAEIWRKLREEFNIYDLEDIWTAFKSAFWQYMHDLESGVVNNWPQKLWRCFAKLEFLIGHRYHTMEPFYYIVRNKFNEEVQRCSELESKGCTPLPTFSLNGINTPQSYEIDAYNLLASIRRHSDIYLQSTMAQKEAAWKTVAKEVDSNVSACRLAFQRALKNYRMYMVRDPANRCRLNYRYYKHMHVIYRSTRSAQKISIKTPSELNQSVSDAPDPNDIIFPERMIFDINMDNSSPTLVLKNWAYGIGNCTAQVQSALPEKIHSLFEKYKNHSRDFT